MIERSMMGTRIRALMLAGVASSACLASPLIAQTNQVEAAQEALREARRAREEAQHALDAANAAIAAAERSLASTPTAPSSAAQTPQVSAQQLAANALCAIDAGSPQQIVLDPNRFQQECLGAAELKNFNTADLNLQVQGSNDGALIEIVPSYTFRWGPYEDPAATLNGFGTRYVRVRGGLRTKIDAGKKTASFADLTEPDLISGVGGVAGVEVGGTFGRRDFSTYSDAVRTALLQARRDCLDSYASDPEEDPLLAPPASQTRVRSRTGVAAACEGEKLSAWMREKPDRQTKYYRSIIAPIWEAKSGVRYYAGLEGTYAKPEYSFFPLSDPAATGIIIVPNLPDAFPKGASSIREEVYSVKGYGGLVFNELVSAGLALSYRRDFTYPKDTEEQTLCNETAASYTLCYKKNIAPPYEKEGWVVGGRLGLQVPRFKLIPPFAVELKPSYAFDVEQFGLQGSLFFAADAEGKQKGGVIVGCTSAGETRTGFPLEKDCKASLFFGTEFNLQGRP